MGFCREHFFDLKSMSFSSSDINNVPLLKKISSKKKHAIISTGASTIEEIKFALNILNLPKNKICLMHCVLNYPTEDKKPIACLLKEREQILIFYLETKK